MCIKPVAKPTPNRKKLYMLGIKAESQNSYSPVDIHFLYKIKIFLLGLPLLLILLCTGESYANNNKYLKSGIEVRFPSSIEVEPGNFGTVVFVFRNPTEKTSSLEISFTSELNWPILGGQNHILLKPGQEEYLALSTMAPPNAEYGTTETIKLKISSGSKESEIYTFNTLVTVKMTRKLRLKAPDRVQGKAGTTIKVPVLVFNQGSIKETPEYSVSSESGWEINWEIPQAELVPGESLNTFLNCKIPDTALIGQTDYLNLKTVSENGQIETLRTMIIVSESAGKTESDTDLTVPLYSNINLSMRSPDEDGNTPWLGGIRLSGDIHPQLNMDFFFSGEKEYGDSTLPSSLYLALTGQNWMMRTGAFDSGWDGLIEAPTSTAMFYLQRRTPTNEKWPWRFWVGSENEVFSSPQWIGASLEGPEQNLTFNFLHSMDENSLYSETLEAQYTPAGFLSDPGWDFTISGAAGVGADDSRLLSQSKISLSRYEPNRQITGEIISGDEFYQTLTDTEKFTELTLSSEIEATHHLTLEPLFKYRLSKDSSGNKMTTSTYQANFLLEQNYLLIRHEDGYSETTNELEIGVWSRIDADKTTGLTLELSNTKPHTLADHDSAKTLSIAFKTRDKLSTVNYLESYIDHSWYAEEGGTRARKIYRSGFGLRWYYSSHPKWQNDGFFQMNTPTDQEIHEITSQINIGYRISPSTTLKLGNILLLGTKDSEYRVGLYLLHRDMFLVPVPWGGIRGKVFSDHNYNNEFDDRDRGISNVHIYLDGRRKAVSAEDGSWIISNVKPGPHKISIVYTHPAQEFSAEKIEYDIEIQPNTMASINIPLYPPREIRGLLFLDENRNDSPDPNEQFLSDVILCVYKGVEGRGQAQVAEVTTQFDGSFLLSLHPGDYLIEVKPDTLPKGIETPDPVLININNDSIPLIFLALRPKEKEIDFSNLDLPEELLKNLK